MSSAPNYDDFVRLEFDGSQTSVVKSCECSQMPNKICTHNRNWRSTPHKRSSGGNIRRSSDQYYSIYSSLKQRNDSEESLASNVVSFIFASSSIEPPEDVLTVILPSGGVATCPFGPETTFGDVKKYLWNIETNTKTTSNTTQRRNSYPSQAKSKYRNRNRSLSVLDGCEKVLYKSKTESDKLYAFKNRSYLDYAFISPLAGRSGDFIFEDCLVTQVQLLDNIVKMVEVGQSRREEVLEQAIGIVIDKPVSKLDCINSEEIKSYRIAMHDCMYKTVMERESKSVEERIAYEFPTEMDDADKMELSSFYLRNDAQFSIGNKPSSTLLSKNDVCSDEVYADVLVGPNMNKEDYSFVNKDKDKIYDSNQQGRKLSIPDYTNEVEEMMRNCRCEGNKHWSWKKLRNVPNKCSKCSLDSKSGNHSDDEQEYADHYEISLSTAKYSFVRVAEEDGFKPKSARFTVWISFEVILNTALGKNFIKNLSPDLINLLNELSLSKEPIKRKDSLLKKITKDNSEQSFLHESEHSRLQRSRSMKERIGKIFRRKSSINKKAEDTFNDESENGEPLTRKIPLEIKTRVDNITPAQLIKKVIHLFLKMIKARLMFYLEEKQFSEYLDISLSLNSSTLKTKKELNNCLASIQDKDSSIAKFIQIMQNFEILPDRYLLQICGYEQFLIRDVPLLSFEYVRDIVSKQLSPQVLLVSKSSVVDSLTIYQYISPLFMQSFSNNSLSRGLFSYEFELVAEQIRNQENLLLSKALSETTHEDYLFLMEENNKSFQILMNNFQASLLNPNMHRFPAKDVRSLKAIKPKQTKNCDESNYATICQQSNKKSIKSTNDDNSMISPIVKSFNGAESENDNIMEMNDYLEKGYHNQDVCSSWKMGTILRFKVILANYINIAGVDQVYVQAGVYHGDELISERLLTRMTDPLNPIWQQLLEFQNMLVSDIPLSATLCLCIVAFSQKGRSDSSYCPVSYANLPFFDHKRRMLSNRITIQMWPVNVFEDVNEEQNFLNPTGQIGSNPDRVSAPRLQIEFENFSNMIIFPLYSEIKRYAECNLKSLKVQSTKKLSKDREEVLQDILSVLDPFWEPTYSQKVFIWEQRYYLRENAPDSLPKLIQSVRWFHREEACEFYVLLEGWPNVSIDTAFNLLQIKYADQIVREFAVKSLDAKLTDGLMMHYMLQLIQLLRTEPYHDTPLARFLLKRALSSRKLGQMMFWTLKSQLSDAKVCIRFSVLLEMYCRGLSDKALEDTVRQLNAFGKFALVLQETENETGNRREKIISKLKSEPVRKMINNLYSPLNITLSLNDLIYKRCRLMDSAKKPLWLEWKNNKKLAWANRVQQNAIIFKTGDDIRQDMLTLQVIRIMDNIWRSYGLDMRMLPYDCLCTGQMVGMIQVVAHAKTVMGIQREGGWLAAHQVDNSKLFKWLKKMNPNNIDAIIDNFARSCAGYCVATFVLGIGDRNPDNIMLNEHGQLFHIDFGHFLGHFKSKLGIKRERVPFVLTRDFIHVITKGSTDPLKTQEFKSFQAMCFRAYLALHDNSHLLIRLFMQMMDTGIPELQSLDDIDYLRASLQIKRNRREALNFFAAAFEEALSGTWSTKVDWLFHSIKHR